MEFHGVKLRDKDCAHPAVLWVLPRSLHNHRRVAVANLGDESGKVVSALLNSCCIGIANLVDSCPVACAHLV